MSRHRNIWDNHWVVWCRERDFDPFEYSVVRLANYLTELQDSQEDNQGSSKNHASFKSHRAGIVAIFSLAHPTKPNLAESPAIKGLAERLRVSAPNGAKYTETISLTPVFMRYIADCKNGMTFWLMSLYELRSRMAMLGRIKTMGRSGDIGVINRMFAGDIDDYAAGCQGDKQNNQILNVRYDFPKTWRSLSRMSEWKKLGEYLHLCPGFLPEYALCCVRSAFEIYYQRTKNLPIETMYDERRPTEPIQRLLLSTKKRNGKYFGMSPTSVGPLIKEQLRLSGIDVKKFQAHIVRSASIALQLGQGNDKDVTLQNAGVSLKVFSIHYNMPLQVSQVPPSLQSLKGDAVAHCLTATSAAAVPTPTVTLPPAGRGQNNSQLCALPPTDAGLQLALEPSPMEQLAAPIRASNGQSKISYTDQEVQLMLGL